MKRALICIAAVAAFMMLAMTPTASAATDTQEDATMNVINVYSSEFTALGTISASESARYYYFVVGSNSHNDFLNFINGDKSKPLGMIGNDRPVIQKGDRVIAYFFSSQVYTNGYATILEFHNFAGDIFEDYLQIRFTMCKSMDIVHHFFMKGSTATIRWVASSTITAYFGGENISKIAEYNGEYYEATVGITENGDYQLWFVNEVNTNMTATISYTVSGFESSKSTGTAAIALILVIMAVFLLVMASFKPIWSKQTSGEITEGNHDDIKGHNSEQELSEDVPAEIEDDISDGGKHDK